MINDKYEKGGNRLKQFLVIISDGIYKALKHRSVDELRSMKSIVEQAVIEYLNKDKKPS